jgi:hypothetical protein
MAKMIPPTNHENEHPVTIKEKEIMSPEAMLRRYSDGSYEDERLSVPQGHCPFPVFWWYSPVHLLASTIQDVHLSGTSSSAMRFEQSVILCNTVTVHRV